MGRVPTMKIRRGDGVVIINEADFDPAKHEPVMNPEEAASAVGSLADLRRAYRQRFGKSPSPRWDAETLAEKLAGED